MTFEEQISAFMDGALNAEQETEFLHILSVSPEKRALFHSYMSVRSAITADARSAAVPARLDDAVLGAAAAAIGGAAAGGAAGGAAAGGAAAGGAAAGGAAAGGAAAGGAAAGGAAAGGAAAAGTAGSAATAGTAGGAGLAAGWWTASRMISAVVLGLSLFTAGYFLPSLVGDDAADTASRTEQTSPATMAPDRTPGSSTAPGARGNTDNPPSPHAGTTGTAADSRHGAESGRSATGGDRSGNRDRSGSGSASGGSDGGPRVVYRNVYVTRVDTVYLPAALAADMRRTASAESEAVRIDATGTDAGPRNTGVARVDTVTIALVQRVPDQRPLLIQEAPRQDITFPLPGRIEVELTREHLTTYPYIDYGAAGVDRNQQQFALSAGYIFDRHHTAGLMVGEKSFAMEYYRIQGDSLYLFQQQPALFYGGGFYRFSLPVAAGIVPELTLQLGGSDLGPVIGGRLGVQLMPFDNLSVVIGANAALLAYRYKDKLFTSHSLGLSYGLRYRF